MSVEGYYLTCDDAECSDCFSLDDWEGFEDWEEPLPIFSDTESDSVTHCQSCGVVIPHELTEYGYASIAESVRDCLRDGTRNPVTHLQVDE